MGLLNYLRDQYRISIGAADEQRSFPRPDNELPLIGAYTASSITPAAALAIADVWAAVRVLADAASSLPIHVYRKTTDRRELVTAGRLVDLLDRPAPATTQADLVSTLMSHLAIYGNAYIGKYRENGEITQLVPLWPERVRPELNAGQLRFRYSPGGGEPQRLLTTADVVHIKALTTDGVCGLSAVTQAASVLGLSDALIKHALSYFDDAAAGGTARPAGVLRLGPDASNTDRERTVEGVRNESRPHGLLVVRGDVDYVPISTPLDDAQFVEQRRLAAQEIARVFRIPPHMLGAPSGDSLTYSTVEQESIDFVRYSLTPWLRRIELAISNDPDLAFQRQYVRFELDGLLRADAKTRADIYALALDPISGWMTREEVRRLEDLEPEPAPTPQQAMTQAVQAAMTNGANNG